MKVNQYALLNPQVIQSQNTDEEENIIEDNSTIPHTYDNDSKYTNPVIIDDRNSVVRNEASNEGGILRDCP